METGLFAIVCDLRSAIVCDRLRSYGNQPLHQAQTECTGTPEKICLNSMIDLFVKPVPGFDDLNLYEFDPQAAHPHDDKLTTVAVDDIDIEIPKDVR